MDSVVDKLTSGDTYKFPNQRKYRTAKKVVDLDTVSGNPDHYKGSILIVHDNCSQTIAKKEEAILIKTNP